MIMPSQTVFAPPPERYTCDLCPEGWAVVTLAPRGGGVVDVCRACVARVVVAAHRDSRDAAGTCELPAEST